MKPSKTKPTPSAATAQMSLPLFDAGADVADVADVADLAVPSGAPVATPAPATAATPSSGADLLPVIRRWSDQGWLRRLDHAFAAFVIELAPDAPACVVLAAALLAQVEGRGHTCLPLDAMLHDPDAWLAWPEEGGAELRAVLSGLPQRPDDWRDALQGSPLVETLNGDRIRRNDNGQPLVLRGSNLYLRRYWRHECEVAAQVGQRQAARARGGDVDSDAARHWLDQLFPPAPSGSPATQALPGAPAIDWQKVACGLALRGSLTVITGGPGTGKTYTAARLLALLLAVEPHPERLRIALAAPTGKAAARLKQSIDSALEELQARLGDRLPLRALTARIGSASTLHSLLGARPDTRKFRHDASHPLELDVLFVDEASMVHLEMMAALLAAVPAGARIVLLGDKDQLASVEAGAVLGELCRDAESGRYDAATVAHVERVTGQRIPEAYRADKAGVVGGPPGSPGSALAQHTVMLRESRRFGGPIGQLALAANAGDAPAAEALLRGVALAGAADADGSTAPGDATPRHARAPSVRSAALRWVDASSAASVVDLATSGYGAYLDALARRPAAAEVDSHAAWVRDVLRSFERFRVLCAVREGEWGATGLNAAIERALVDAGSLGKRGEWYAGRPVMVTRNDRSIGVFNGDIGIALRPAAAGGPLRAYFLDGDTVRSVSVSRLADVETAFAMTVHKSQGSEFEHTVLVLPAAPSRVLTRELVYTGITRARDAFTLVTGRTQALADALAQRTQRASGLLELLGAVE